MRVGVFLSFIFTLNACSDEGLNDFNNGGFTGTNNFSGTNHGSTNTENPPPIEKEEFLVREVASSDSYVFVPNTAANSASVARIDARDLSINSLTVGLNPSDVVATENEELGAIAYVLCEGNDTLALIRADQPSRDGRGLGHVSLLEIPRETNRLTMASQWKIGYRMDRPRARNR